MINVKPVFIILNCALLFVNVLINAYQHNLNAVFGWVAALFGWVAALILLIAYGVRDEE
jgi:hypothetical protein